MTLQNIPTKLESTKGVLTVSQLAAIMDLSGKTIRKWMRRYGLPYTKVGSSYWLDPHSVAEWLRFHTVVRSSQKRH
jgi:excisionase family DNA binding protein